MDDQKYQKELFHFNEPKKSFPRFANIFPKPDLEKLGVVITLTLDKVVFLSIGIIMLMVVIYALGIEVGKMRVRELMSMRPSAESMGSGVNSAPIRPPQVAAIQVKSAKQSQRPQSALAASTFPSLGAASQTKATLPYRDRLRAASEKSFTVVVGTYRNRETALQDVDRFKKIGFDAFLSLNGEYYRVSAGSYGSKESALKALANVKKVRPDAYIKEGGQ